MQVKKRDIAVVTLADGRKDIGIGSDGDLLAVEGFETSIDLSLFTNRRATASEVPQAKNRRGWIGDLVANSGWLVGSTLWLYEQSRLTQQVVNLIEDAAKKSLEWLVNIGAADRVDAAAEITNLRQGQVSLRVDIYVTNNIITRYFNIWVGTKVSQ